VNIQVTIYCMVCFEFPLAKYFGEMKVIACHAAHFLASSATPKGRRSKRLPRTRTSSNETCWQRNGQNGYCCISATIPAATVHRQLASIVKGSRDVKWSSLQRTQQLWQQGQRAASSSGNAGSNKRKPTGVTRAPVAIEAKSLQKRSRETTVLLQLLLPFLLLLACHPLLPAAACTKAVLRSLT